MSSSEDRGSGSFRAAPSGYDAETVRPPAPEPMAIEGVPELATPTEPDSTLTEQGGPAWQATAPIHPPVAIDVADANAADNAISAVWRQAQAILDASAPRGKLRRQQILRKAPLQTAAARPRRVQPKPVPRSDRPERGHNRASAVPKLVLGLVALLCLGWIVLVWITARAHSAH